MTNHTIDAWMSLFNERIKLGIKKNNDYSSGGRIDNIAMAGIEGIAIRLFDKACRLMSLVVYKTDRKVMDESIEDTLKDMANYSDYGVLLRRGEWQRKEKEVVSIEKKNPGSVNTSPAG